MSRTYYIFNIGRLRRKDNTLAYETDNERRMMPVEDVDHIYCFAEMDFNTKSLDFLAKNKICLHFFNYYGHYSGSFVPREGLLSGHLIVKQVEHYLDNTKRITIAKKIIEAALHNIRRNLEKREIDEFCNKIDLYREGLRKCNSIEEIFSIEAHAHKTYYSYWEEVTGWPFVARSKQPPENELNALLSFGNTLTYTTILKEIYKTALNPTISYLHEPSERRYSLSLDIAEIFKPVFVDKLIFRLINLGMIKEEYFDKNLNFAYLTDQGKKIFIREFENQLETTIVHRNLKRKVKYKSLIRLDLYKLIKHLIGEEEYNPMKVWW